MSEEIKKEPTGEAKGDFTIGSQKDPERVFKFTKREHADKEPEMISVNESELDEHQLEATYQYLILIFNNSPFKTQQRLIDEILSMVGNIMENAPEIVTPNKTIIDANGQPIKSHLKKVE